MFNDINSRTKIAALFFILGKITSLPTLYLVMSGNRNAYFFIVLYAFLIFISIVLAFLEKRSNNLEKEILNMIRNGKSFTVKEGKILKINS